MKRIVILFAAVILAASSLVACGASTQGPTTWMDRPLDGTHVPLASITIQAHASDEDGVASIEFYVSESLIASIPAGGIRLGQASIDWMPPGPGTYTIIARAIDSQGNFGPQTNLQISVGDLVATITPTIILTSTISPKPTTLPSATYIPGEPSFTLIQNANCRVGPGTAYEVDETLFQGQTIPIEGRNETSNWFWVVKPNGHGHCWVSVITGQVVGDVDTVQIVSAPSLPEPSADTTPPEITDFFTDPGSIQKEGCGEPSTALVSATVSDAGGVSRVVARILGTGEVEMSPVGGVVYQAVLGPFSDAGEYSIIILAWDNAGNNNNAGPISILVACIQ
jgi:hypothetical protein